MDLINGLDLQCSAFLSSVDDDRLVTTLQDKAPTGGKISRLQSHASNFHANDG